MFGKHTSKPSPFRRKAIISQGSVLFSQTDQILKSIKLRHGLSLIDTEQKTILKNGSTILNSWSTEEWNLLGVDSRERVAFFEATDSWLLAKLDLETGSFQPDDDPLFIQYDLQTDESGTFVYDELTTDKFYIK
jgi:hypothetical protein